MGVVLSAYDSRGGVEPLVALAVRVPELGAEVQVCAPPDRAERLAEVGVPLLQPRGIAEPGPATRRPRASRREPTTARVWS